MVIQVADMAGSSSRNNNSKKRKNSEADAEPAQKKVKVDDSVSHSSHLHQPGVVLCLGEGDVGQLGLGPDVMERKKPGLVTLPAKVLQVCAGGMHTVCVTQDGKVYTFGCNDEGALGRKAEEEEECAEPGLVSLPEKVLQVSAGDSHTAALTKSGNVYLWGTFRDANGSIGLTPDVKISHAPVKVMSKVAKIASGVDHVVCLTVSGEVYSVGNSQQGQLGRVSECFSDRGGRKGLSFLLSPAKVFFRRRKLQFSDVWTGQYNTYAKVKGSQQVYGWGLNNYYQLGLGDMENRFVPERIKAFEMCEWKEMVGGQHHTVMLSSEGKVYCLGRHDYGRLGLGDIKTEMKTPTLVKALENNTCVSIGGGTCVSFATTQNGEVYGWGMASNNQLATGEEDDVEEPVLMTGKQLENRAGLMVSGGGQHTVILAQDKS